LEDLLATGNSGVRGTTGEKGESSWYVLHLPKQEQQLDGQHILPHQDGGDGATSANN